MTFAAFVRENDGWRVGPNSEAEKQFYMGYSKVMEIIIRNTRIFDFGLLGETNKQNLSRIRKNFK